MTHMLQKNTVSRLFKLPKIQQHLWFKTFNWDGLISLTNDVPYKPKVNKDDISKSKPYVQHMKSIKDWIPNKDSSLQNLDEKLVKEYEKWHSEF